jgi:hypothetical protein
MTTAEKEKRIMDLGKPWTKIMDGLKPNRSLTPEEASGPYKTGFSLAREHWYSVGLSAILDAAWEAQESKETSN